MTNPASAISLYLQRGLTSAINLDAWVEDANSQIGSVFIDPVLQRGRDGVMEGERGRRQEAGVHLGSISRCTLRCIRRRVDVAVWQKSLIYIRVVNAEQKALHCCTITNGDDAVFLTLCKSCSSDAKPIYTLTTRGHFPPLNLKICG